MAFFRPAGTDQLYSGDTISTPSAALMASFNASISFGMPVAC